MKNQKILILLDSARLICASHNSLHLKYIALQQKDNFRKALSIQNGSDESDDLLNDFISEDQIIETRDTMDDFFKSHGEIRTEHTANRITTTYGTLFFWPKIKTPKGKKDLYVMDCGDVRLACLW